MVQFSTTLSPSFREESLCFARFHQIFALHSVRWIYGSSVFEIPYNLFDVEILVFYNINTFCPLKLSLIELYASRVPTKCLFCRMNCILQSAFAEVLLKVLFFRVRWRYNFLRILSLLERSCFIRSYKKFKVHACIIYNTFVWSVLYFLWSENFNFPIFVPFLFNFIAFLSWNVNASWIFVKIFGIRAYLFYSVEWIYKIFVCNIL